MATELEEQEMIKDSGSLCDEVWQIVQGWNEFARDTVGKQLVRAADSIGANMAESYGRFNYGEKIQFLYYARGSIFETKYWISRAINRSLIKPDLRSIKVSQITGLARQVNAFVAHLKNRKQADTTTKAQFREDRAEYFADVDSNVNFNPTFTEADLDWLES